MFCNHVAFPLDLDAGAPSFRAFVIALCLLMISVDGLQYVFRSSPHGTFFLFGAEKNSRKNAKANDDWIGRTECKPIEKSPERMN
jgi:hypothetical protein